MQNALTSMCKSHQIQTCYHSRNTASQGKIKGKNANYSIANMLALEGLSASLRYMAVCLSIGESLGKEILEGHTDICSRFTIAPQGVFSTPWLVLLHTGEICGRIVS